MILTERDRLRFSKYLRRDESSGCLLFVGSRSKKGHGSFRVGPNIELAHNVAWALAGNSVPDGFRLAHRCPSGGWGVHNCCEIAHLVVMTDAEHRRLVAAEREGARFASHLKRNSLTGCIEFIGHKSKFGYGKILFRGKIVEAHRVAWILAGRDIPPETPCVLHNCPAGDNPACCNAEHLWLGTRTDNNTDKARKGRGARSRKGLPYGVVAQGNGRYQAVPTINGKTKSFGVFDTWQEAAAIALYHKNLSLFPDLSVN